MLVQLNANIATVWGKIDLADIGRNLYLSHLRLFVGQRPVLQLGQTVLDASNPASSVGTVEWMDQLAWNSAAGFTSPCVLIDPDLNFPDPQLFGDLSLGAATIKAGQLTVAGAAQPQSLSAPTFGSPQCQCSFDPAFNFGPGVSSNTFSLASAMDEGSSLVAGNDPTPLMACTAMQNIASGIAAGVLLRHPDLRQHLIGLGVTPY